MPLPKIDVPVYDIDLPLSKKHISFRPFLVKEQRNLLMAMESNDSSTIEKNIRQVLNNCTLTEGIIIDQLPVVDIEYFFLNLRARSVGEVAENKYRCNNEVDGKECGHISEVNIDILNIKLETSDVSEKIMLTPNMMIKFNYPVFASLSSAKNTENISEFAFNMIIDCIDYIHDGEQFYYAKETTREELVEFIDSLNTDQFSKIEEFFNNLPKLRKEVRFKCKKCGFEHLIEAEGLESFFG